MSPWLPVAESTDAPAAVVSRCSPDGFGGVRPDAVHGRAAVCEGQSGPGQRGQVRAHGPQFQRVWPPQPQTPQPPTPPTPQTATPNANLPALDIQLPSLASGVAVNSAPAPSLSGLAPGAPAPAPPSEAAESGGRMGGMESEVMPLNDV